MGDFDSSRSGEIGMLRPANYGLSIRHAENRQKKTEGSDSVMSEVTGGHERRDLWTVRNIVV